MNNFDGPRKGEMDELLNFIYKMSATKELDSTDVYGTLCYYGLKDKDRPRDPQGRIALDGLNNEDYFRYWIERFRGKRNINVFVNPNWSFFCQFTNNIGDRDNYIKLYVALDYDHLYDGANLLFDFLERNNISHLSKISKKVRVDNVIVRLEINDMETAQKIINFINTVPYLKAGLNKPNPFIPTIGGVGIMREHGNSYNSDISRYIKEYINLARKRGDKSVSAEGFRKFLMACKQNNICYKQYQTSFDDSLLSTFEIAYNGRNKDLNLGNDLKGPVRLTDDQKRKILIDALRATYQKYGFEQVRVALLNIVKYGNYNFITNGGPSNRFREVLKNNLTPNDVITIVNDINRIKGGMDYFSDEDKIFAYTSDLFSSDLPFILDEIAMVTLENYNEVQLATAINYFVQQNNGKYFSRFRGNDRSINYRNKLAIFNPRSMEEAMISSLANKGVYAANLSGPSLSRIYANALSRSLTNGMVL